MKISIMRFLSAALLVTFLLTSCGKETPKEQTAGNMKEMTLNADFHLVYDTTKYVFHPEMLEGKGSDLKYHFHIAQDSQWVSLDIAQYGTTDSLGNQIMVRPAKDAVEEIRTKTIDNSTANNINSDITPITEYNGFNWFSVTGNIGNPKYPWYHSTYGAQNFSNGRIVVIYAQAYATVPRNLQSAFKEFATGIRDVKSKP